MTVLVPRSRTRDCDSFYSFERGIDVRIIRPEPVAEAAASQFSCCPRRRAFHHIVLTVEEVGRVLRVRGHRFETGERTKNGRRPLPSIPGEIVDAPRARARRKRSNRGRFEPGETEVAVFRSGRDFSPG